MTVKRSILTCFGLCASLLLTSCQSEMGLLSPAGPVAEAQRDHLVSILLWMLLVSVPVFVGVPLLIWRYRIGSNAAYRPRWAYSTLIETLLWALPAVVVAVLGYNLVRETFSLDPYQSTDPSVEPVEIQAIGFDWKWLFIYPRENIATLNALYVPEGRPIRFHITSVGAMQSFMIPQLGGQMYAMPGMVSALYLEASKAGEFKGLNTQYNGTDFAKQYFTVHALTKADYDAWLTSAKAGGNTLDDNAMSKISEKSVPKEPVIFSDINGPSFNSVLKSVRETDKANETTDEGPKS